MPGGTPERAKVLRDIRGELSARVKLLRRQEEEVAQLRKKKEREAERMAFLDESRQ